MPSLRDPLLALKAEGKLMRIAVERRGAAEKAERN